MIIYFISSDMIMHILQECLSLTQRTMLESYRQGVIEAQRRELEQRMSAAVKEAEDKVATLLLYC